MIVTKEQIAEAKHTNLYDFLITHYRDEHRIYYDSLRPKFCKTISIKQGYRGYLDFKTEETGDNISYLVRYLGYSFQDAVLALINEKEQSYLKIKPNEKKNNSLSVTELLIPQRNVDNLTVIGYLNKQRCISRSIIANLIEQGILYEDIRNNCVFINQQRNFIELRGTRVKKAFHGVGKGSMKNGFWYVNDFVRKNADEAEKADEIVVCECAIDAISCLELMRMQRKAESKNITYISIAGVGKQGAIDRLKRARKNVVLAVDNDEAGDICRKRNSDCRSMVPPKGFKDWNEYLVSIKQNCGGLAGKA